jgi:hypothetical protein
MQPIFSNHSSIKMLLSEPLPSINSCMRHYCCSKCECRDQSTREMKTHETTVSQMVELHPVMPTSKSAEDKIRDGTMAEERTQEMLRDLLYWSIFTDRIDMAKVLILHMRTRICAALSCVAILRNRASRVTINDKRHLYKQYATDFEIYATDCINACYLRNERKACELLIREVPLFGKITCMQVKITLFFIHFKHL